MPIACAFNGAGARNGAPVLANGAGFLALRGLGEWVLVLHTEGHLRVFIMRERRPVL